MERYQNCPELDLMKSRLFISGTSFRPFALNLSRPMPALCYWAFALAGGGQGLQRHLLPFFGRHGRVDGRLATRPPPAVAGEGDDGGLVQSVGDAPPDEQHLETHLHIASLQGGDEVEAAKPLEDVPLGDPDRPRGFGVEDGDTPRVAPARQLVARRVQRRATEDLFDDLGVGKQLVHVFISFSPIRPRADCPNS